MNARDQFGRQASYYATSSVHASGADGVVELLGPLSDAVALDVGTGAGHTAHALARRARHVLASDITPEMLTETRRLAAGMGLANLQPIFSLAEDLPYADASLDIVTCRLAAHHFRDVSAFCREVARVLKPGGRALVQDTISPEDDLVRDFINDVEARRDPSHVDDYKASTWRRLLEEAGLEVLDLQTVAGDSSHELYEWTERAATPAADVAYIRERFAAAPPAVAASLRLERDGDTFRWSWHIATILLQRPPTT